MAFDQTTRNRLQKFVSQTKSLLSDEFTRQLQNDYGMDPDTGTVSDIENLPHLTDAELQTAKLLRETVGHYQTSSPGSDEKEILSRIVREQAFTVLNRLCALRMAEARGILIESISKGYNSKGFQLYARVANTSLGESGDTYRNYLFSVFDEFAMDLAVLFDRYSPMGRLFPKESVLLELLDQINDVEIETLWAEDETIGWIYQYFNSKEERKKMRNESPAPRNSRELAVRNQFFTPRYVVEFLTDNTLGRIWYEMTQGDTRLKDQCRYLVRRPHEIFLKKGEKAPEQNDNDADLTQEELLNQPVHIEHRPVKDPREILMLDPACGSMHFGLYAFDLFEKIYEEAWDFQASGKWQGVDSEKFGLLTETYTTKEALLKDIPRLIIENNIHGVDIDPRAVQIAGLSLWLRAQRSWKNQNVKPNSRPQIRKSNIVCAEPMPGEKEFLKGFSENLKPRVLGQLVEIIFKKMELVGEAGSLLKIEEEIEEAVEKAREEFNKELLHRKEEAGYLPGFAPKQRQRELFDFADLPDKTKFWQTAEQKILEALRNYAEKAEAEGGSRLRLFVEDAAKGFAFIDLCTKRYDVVLMNPPFGEPVNTTKILMSNNYREAKSDIDAAFIDRMSDLLSQEGLLGGIYNRTQFFKGYLENWRNRNLLIDRQIQSCIDLGLGVLDGAMVETAAYTTSHKNYGSYSHFISTLSYANKNLEICRVFDLIKQKLLSSRSHLISLKNILQLPKHRISYWLSPRIVKTFRKHRPLEGQFGFARQGLITADNDRFLRLAWEVPETEILKFHNKKYDNKSHKKWAYYAKGGNYAPYYGDIHLTVNWKDEGREISNFFKKGKLASRPQNISFYFKKALTYTERTTSDISPRAMPSCCIFDCKGPVIAPSNVNVDISGMLALTNSKLYKYFVELSLAGGDGAARQFTQSIVGGVPVPSSFREISSTLGEMSRSIWKIIAERESCIETSRFFSCQRFCLIPYSKSLKDIILRINKYYNNKLISILNLTLDIDNKVYQLYELNDKDRLEIERVCGRHPIELNGSDFINLPISKQKQLLSSEVDSIVSEFRKTDDTNKFLSKNCYYADKQIEVLSNGYSTNAKIIIDKFDQLQVIKKNVYIEWVEELLSYFFGTVFGRWDIRYGTKEKSIAELPDPFDPLPVCPPGLLQNSIGYQANSNDIPADYPLSIPWSGIIVDDEGYPEDVITCLREAIEVIWKDKANDIEQEACEILGVRDLREYFSKPGRFFAEHLKRYSKSRRQAPIYWPLSTPSGSYTLWLYYHRLTDQTLYTCVNNFVGPKLKQVADDVDNLRKKSNRSRQEEKELEKLSDLAVELKDFDDELLRIAKFWKPNLNDGVQITAAPLWKLFRLKPWQNKLKKTWNVLEKGKYDWAHLAYSIWPERVIRASHKDRSYAIAHDLEDDLWEEIETGKDRKGNPKSKWVPKKLSENELKELIAQKTEGNV